MPRRRRCRHRDVQQGDVGLQPRRQLHGRAPARRERDDLDPWVGREQRRGAVAHQPVVVGDQHTCEDLAIAHPSQDGGKWLPIPVFCAVRLLAALTDGHSV